jgi:integrase
MTEKRVLTDAYLRAIEASGDRREVWDVGNPGFGIRIGSQGDVSFQYLYRTGGKSRRYTLGKFPLVSLHAARMEFHKAALMVAEGRDPAQEKANAKVAQNEAVTVRLLCDEFVERYAKIHKRSWLEDARKLQRDVVPLLGKKLAQDVTRKDIGSLLDAKMDAGSPVAANRLQALLSKLFAWAVERGHMDSSPCTGVRKPARETSRDRVLQHAEIFPLWHALDSGQNVGMHIVTRRALQVMLMTGQRKGEVLKMRWEHVDGTGEGWVWNIPAANAKNAKRHRVPLHGDVIALLEGLRKEMAHSATGLTSPWCFPSPSRPLQHLSLTGPDHALREELKRPDGPLKGLAHFTPHDCRRTVATGLSVLGFPRLIVQKVLNHVDTTTTAVYDRYGYDKEKREALDQWGQMLFAATWPAGREIDPETGEEVVHWDFQREWNRMVF